MKGNKKILIVEIIAIFLLLYNITVLDFLKNQYVGCFFLASVLGIIIFFHGFEKDKSERTLDVNFSMLSYCLCYIMFIYILGIFTGFARPIYSLEFFNILKNITPVVLTIVVEELLRYEIVTKVKGSKKQLYALALLVVMLILFDSKAAFPMPKDIKSILDNISLIIFPSIAKNIMFTYLMYLIGYKPVILYRLLMELPIFITPIYPNLGAYVTGVLEISFPFIVCILMRSIVVKKRNFFVREDKSIIGTVLSIIIGIFLVIMVILTSGFFKYYALGVVSNSMYPQIKRGDVVIVKKTSKEEKKDIQVGEILVFRADNRVIVHRVIEKNEGSGGYTFKTKGDNNPAPDDITIYEKDIIGVAKYKIPKIGYPSVWLSEWRVKE